MTTKEKLIKLRESLGLSQEEFGGRMSVSKQYVSQIETSVRNAGLKYLRKVSEAFGVPVADLIGEKEQMIVTEDDESLLLKMLVGATPEEKKKILNAIYRIRKVPLREIPVLGYVQAGVPLDLVDITEPIDLVLIPESESERAEFAVIVRGDSMVDRGIHHADELLVSPDETPQIGDLVIAIIDNKATFKSLAFRDGKYWLEPANNHYQPIELTPDMDVKLYKVKKIIKKIIKKT